LGVAASGGRSSTKQCEEGHPSAQRVIIRGRHDTASTAQGTSILNFGAAAR
jgi:hypothetical protein